MVHIEAEGLMTRRMPLAEVRASIAAAVDQVFHRGEHVVIERHGRPVAALVSIDDLARLEAERPTGERPAGALALVGAWADVEDTEIDAFLVDVASARQRDTGRKVRLKA